MEERSQGQVNRAELRQILTIYFDESELRTLCFDLEIDYESLAGQGKRDKARELVAYAARRGRTAELVRLCRDLRPNVDWQKAVHIVPPERLPPDVGSYYPSGDRMDQQE